MGTFGIIGMIGIFKTIRRVKTIKRFRNYKLRVFESWVGGRVLSFGEGREVLQPGGRQGLPLAKGEVRGSVPLSSEPALSAIERGGAGGSPVAMLEYLYIKITPKPKPVLFGVKELGENFSSFTKLKSFGKVE